MSLFSTTIRWVTCITRMMRTGHEYPWRQRNEWGGDEGVGPDPDATGIVILSLSKCHWISAASLSELSGQTVLLLKWSGELSWLKGMCNMGHATTCTLRFFFFAEWRGIIEIPAKKYEPRKNLFCIIEHVFWPSSRQRRSGSRFRDLGAIPAPSSGTLLSDSGSVLNFP